MFKVKRGISQETQTQFKMIEHKEEIHRQHTATHRRAVIGGASIIPAIGPWPRNAFPLLKIKEKEKEFFVRTGKYTIIRYFINEDSFQDMDHFFYPTEKAIEELKNENDGHFSNLYRRLVADGLGSFSPIKTNKSGRMSLKRTTETKPKTKKLSLRKTNEKAKTEKDTKKKPTKKHLISRLKISRLSK